MINLGSVPFLNARPLIYPLEKGFIDHNFNIFYYNPSTLSKKLYKNEVDIGLIPVAEFLDRDEYLALPDISISSYGKVDSVVLLCRDKIKNLKTVAIDSRSQSSTALLKIILEVFIGIKPKYLKKDVDDNFLENVDGGMLIGNSGLKALYSDNNDFIVYDLGELWTENTGLPFVYAVFAHKKEFNPVNSASLLLQAKNKGIGLVSEIADREHKKLGLTKNQCGIYLGERIKFDLDSEKIKGLREYQKLFFEIGELKRIKEIEFFE